MMNQENDTAKKNLKSLREKARQKLLDAHVETIQLENMSVDDIRHFIEELRIHQIELEMQNQQLLETQQKLEKAKQKYEELYDFAPVGYLNLGLDGKILEANLTAAKMLDIPRNSLIGTLLYHYFNKEDRDCLFLHLRKLFRRYGRHTCEARLADKNHNVYLRLDSIRDEGDKEKQVCRTTMVEITHRKRTEIALKRSEFQLKKLSSNLIETQEKERKRIAHDLHDGVAQMLAASKFYAQNLMSRLSDNSDEYRMLMKCIDINQSALTDLKRIVSDLRPTVLDSMGIIAAIEWLSKQYQTTDPPLTIIRKINVKEDKISEQLKPVIFRILQESMFNVVQHSSASQVVISLVKFNEHLELAVKDNGKGFELGDVLFKKNLQKGIGITSMTERARNSGGCLEVLSSRKTGTTVTIRWPRPGLKGNDIERVS